MNPAGPVDLVVDGDALTMGLARLLAVSGRMHECARFLARTAGFMNRREVLRRLEFVTDSLHNLQWLGNALTRRDRREALSACALLLRGFEGPRALLEDDGGRNCGWKTVVTDEWGSSYSDLPGEVAAAVRGLQVALGGEPGVAP